MKRAIIAVVLGTLAIGTVLGTAAQDRAPKRRAWTTSRITGSPEPPRPFRVKRAFPKLTFEKPVHLVPFPGRKRWAAVIEKGGIYTFRNDPAVEKADWLIDFTKGLPSLNARKDHRGIKQCYAIAFDPDFEENRHCYVMYVLRSKGKDELKDGSIISRFTITKTDPPRIDPASELILLKWLAGGHNGCDLQWGNDGYLYVSTGDGERPHPPDSLRAGQDVSNLLSSVLRIDVRNATAAQPYRIPGDNPFAGRKGIRGEIWSYGFRNPWRMAFDRSTGKLWLGDVGWERWEMVYCAEKGGNYGWSVMEGPTPCNPDWERGPTPIRPPAHSLPHPESASITGGLVYRGKRLKGYQGHYLYGDWETRRIWANPIVDKTKLGDRVEIARTPCRIIAFAEDENHEVLVVDHEGGGIYELVPNEAVGKNSDFPRKLSQTGLFTSVPNETPAPGVVPYSVNASRWAEGASARRWIALPRRESIQLIDKNKVWPKESIWPKDSVLAKTYTLEGRKVETQILHFDGHSWNAYGYLWNKEQTDAALVGAPGADADLGNGRTWKVPARSACLTCHNPWPGYSLTITPDQIAREHPYPEGKLDQIKAFQLMGFLPKELKRTGTPLVDPYDKNAPLEGRARSYMAVNCAHCHRWGGGGSAMINLVHTAPLKEMYAHAVRPTLGTFNLTDPYILSGRDPSRSILLFRMSTMGQGRMPHLGSDIVDERGVELLRRWIAQLPPVPTADETRKERERHKAALELLKQGRTEQIASLLKTPTSALDLLATLPELPDAARKAAIDQALARPPGPVRDLFERFEPPSKRRKRLGRSVDAKALLAMKGDAERGKRLFASPGIQCSKCHQVRAKEESLGPDLSKLKPKRSREEILESILHPTRKIDPKYAGILIQTKDDEILNGILVSRSESEIVIRDASKVTRVPASRIRRTAPQAKSLMPEFLLQSLTAQEAADLLAYLASLQ